MGVYDRQIALATRMIAAKGQLCTWREPGEPTGTPAAPVAGEPTDYPARIVFLPNTQREGLASFLAMFGGTEVPTGGMRGLMATVPFTPSLLGQIVRAPAWDDDLPALGLMDEKGIDKLDVNGEIILWYLRFSR